MLRTFLGRKLIAAAFVISLATLANAQYVTLTSPSNGVSTVSPVHVVASANGGSYPATAMRLYVDSQPVTTISAASMNTYTSMSTGSHYVVVVGWNSKGASFYKAATVKVTSSSPAPGSVTISSPGTSASGSSLHFVASATPSSGRSIVAMAVYLDSQLSYKTGSSTVDTYVPVTQGTHNAVVQSWDNAGSVSKNQVTVSVSGSSPSPAPPTPGSGPFASDFSSTSNWMAGQFRSTGALMYSTERINPYYSNLAAMGLVKDPTRYVDVENWMRWYISHLNHTDRWGLGGTMYDYNIVSGREVSSGDADSTDSYAATFLSLAYAYFATGNAAAQSYVRSIAGDLDLIAQVLAKTQQSDGLTWAKPNYQIKYLMDNSEVYRGLADVATLFGSMGNTSKQNYYSALATKCQSGVWGMWMGNYWAVYKDGIGRLIGPNMGTWYPDATAQTFPVLYGVVSGSDPKAQTSYAYFNRAWPGWPNLSFNAQDPFPWAMIAGAAAQMGDKNRVNAYATAARGKWLDKGFPWTWYPMEAGWYMRVANYMDGGTF